MATTQKQGSSVQARKQRKARYDAKLHERQRFVGVNLSKDLRKTHATRTVAVRKGDTVKVLRGQFKGKEGLVQRVDLKRERLLVEGVDVLKKDGSKVHYPVHPSNVQLKKLDLADQKRKASIARANPAQKN